MTAPNRNALWSRALVDELAAAGVEAVCVAPGSRSTPLAMAVAAHPDVRAFSHLDERSAGFFALGRGKVTGRPTAVVCTSGTAGANLHPAVVEADRARVPLLVLTADRPPALHDSGANQTVDQSGLYAGAVRWARTLPEPEAEARKLRSLRTTAARAVARTAGTHPGPVHLNVPFRKPLEPSPVPGDVPEEFGADAPLAADGREGPFVRTAQGRPALSEDRLAAVADAVSAADRGLVVAGPADDGLSGDALAALADATGFPVLADPVSDLRFGGDPDGLVCGGYDSYLDPRVTDGWPDPEVVLRFGASPTSKTLRHYLRDAGGRQFVVDPAGEWPEAEFTATDHLVADPDGLAVALAARVEAGESAWTDRFRAAERDYWAVVEEAREESFFEGAVLATVAELAPDPSTLFVSNSMPVRDLDRFGRPRAADLSVLANRGASGIDGITSTALGAASATDEPLVLVLGDLAYYHDMNGLLAVERCDVDATVVLVNNDGGGIFHMLPVEAFDPPFTELFKTPHGLDFEPSADLYGLEFERVADPDAFERAYRESLAAEGTQVLEVRLDGEESHRTREAVHDAVCERLG